jgi:hypothetical protein
MKIIGVLKNFWNSKEKKNTSGNIYVFTKQLLRFLKIDASDANFKYEMHYICSATPHNYTGEGYTKYYCTPVYAFFKARPINTKIGQEIMGEPVSPNFSHCTTIHYERLKDFNYKRICIAENEGKNKFKSSLDKPFMIHVSINERHYKDNKYYSKQIDQTELPQTVLKKVL